MLTVRRHREVDYHGDGITVVMVHADSGDGGPGRTMASLAKFVVARHPLVVVAPDGFLLDSVRELPGVRVVPIPVKEDGSAKRVAGTRAVARVASGIAGPFLFHANGASALNLIAPAAIRGRQPVLVHFHSSALPPRSASALRAWSWLGLRAWFCPVSELSADLLRSHGYADRILGLLGNPIDTYRPEDELCQLHEPFRVGWIGSSKPVKGLDRVVEIANRAHGRSIEWRLYGIGEDRLTRPYVAAARARLEELGLDDCVKWCGRVSDSSMAFREIDALLVTSSSESLPRVVIEAMAYGVPIVAGRIPAIEALISDGENGYLYRLEQAMEALDVLEVLMVDGGTRSRLVSCGLQTAMRYRPERVAGLAEQMYATVLAAAYVGAAKNAI
jgi:glycosyltransferase involved in cell wall biosynthesis